MTRCRRILVIDDNTAIHDEFCKILEIDRRGNAALSDEPSHPTLNRFAMDCADQGRTGYAMVQHVAEGPGSRPTAGGGVTKYVKH